MLRDRLGSAPTGIAPPPIYVPYCAISGLSVMLRPPSVPSRIGAGRGCVSPEADVTVGPKTKVPTLVCHRHFYLCSSFSFKCFPKRESQLEPYLIPQLPLKPRTVLMMPPVQIRAKVPPR